MKCKTKTGVVLGASLKEIEDKRFNIYLGISLGNKWFTKENIKESIKWGLRYTKERFCVQIADTLHAINYEVREGCSKRKANKRALKEGDIFVELVKEILRELPEKDRERIDIIRWDDIRKDKEYQRQFHFLTNKFEKDLGFKREIKSIVRDFYVNRLRREPDEEKIEKLCYYVLDELPELLNGFEHNGVKYNCWIYPHYVKFVNLVYDLQKGKKFQEVKENLKIGNNVFVQLEILK
jgi:tRNA-dependent cyclodipeptide synthase